MMHVVVLALACVSWADHATAQSQATNHALSKFLTPAHALPRPSNKVTVAAGDALPRTPPAVALDGRIAELQEQNDAMKAELQYLQSQADKMGIPSQADVEKMGTQSQDDARDSQDGSLMYGLGGFAILALALSSGRLALKKYLRDRQSRSLAGSATTISVPLMPQARQRAGPILASAALSQTPSRAGNICMQQAVDGALAKGNVGCVGIVGSSGAVGKEMLHCLEARHFPTDKIRLFARRAAGETVKTRAGNIEVEAFSVEAAQECDIVLMAVSGDFATKFGPEIAGGPKNTQVIDNSSAFRYKDEIPLVIPEINGDSTSLQAPLIANPNCTTAIGAMALWPLHQKYKLKKVIMSTYQSASGAGAEGMSELEEGHAAFVKDGKVPEPDVFAHQLPFNVIPQIDAFQENGYTKEEMKVAWELKKIFGLPDEVKVSCTSVRVPTLRAHSESITVETELPIDPDEARELLRNAPGVEVVDKPESLEYPMPLMASGQEDVQVGRIRQSLVFGDHGLEFFVAGDQLLRGAALNAVLIAEQSVKSPSSTEDKDAPLHGRVPWGMHKFGGASLADAELYRTCGNILIQQSTLHGISTPTAAVVSAMKGMTDKLVEVVETAAKADGLPDAREKLEAIVKTHVYTATELLEGSPDLKNAIIENITSDSKAIDALLISTNLLRTVQNSTMELVAGTGEVWSAQLLSAYLKTQGAPAEWLNARDVLVVEGSDSGLGAKGAALDMGVTPLYDVTSKNLEAWWQDNSKALLEGEKPPIVIITGFVASTIEGAPTTLKRSGSDFSATIFSKLLKAASVTMWKNTNGVYRADPGVLAKEPVSVKTMSYEEAVELAYFGGQVLHPLAMSPIMDDNTPVYVRNIFNTEFPGTKISTKGDPNESVQVITSIPNIAMVNLDAGSFASVPKVTLRAMSALDAADVKVVLISQSSATHSLAVAVDEAEGERAAQAIKSAFEFELARGEVEGVHVAPGHSILAVVGEGMAGAVGTIGKLAASMARTKTNVVAIAQGSSERSICIVVERSALNEAMQAAYCEFTGQQCSLDVAVEESLNQRAQPIKELQIA